MCGICGQFYYKSDRLVSAEQILKMRDTMVHRGPDDAGIFVDGNIGLGHRRLSIIDIEGSKQPMSNENDTVWIVYNGEIYNFQELRRELIDKGHVFKTNGDTETIVHLYEEYGEACVKKLEGMFSFAIWNKNTKSLFVARDRLGIKPFYYLADDSKFIFASEIKAILKDNEVRPQIDFSALGSYISFRHVYGSHTLFKNIRELMPGHYALLSMNHSPQVIRYWDVDIEKKEKTSLPAAIERFSELLNRAVKMRMISDVPLGAFLSGGIDSSVIVAIMAKYTDYPVECFSVGFLPEDESELGYAKIVAKHTNSNLNQFVVDDKDFFELVNKLIWHNDEPITFSASIPLYILCQQTKEKATVMLSGEGSDEIFGGYLTNLKALRINQFKRYCPPALIQYLANMTLPKKQISNFLRRAVLNDNENILSTFEVYSDSEINQISKLIEKRCTLEECQPLLNSKIDSNENFLSRLLYFQLKTYLCALLMKQDKMSMAASIESRVPFLDHHLVEYVFGLPDSLKVHFNKQKYLLKEFAKTLIPKQIINRKKAGFPVPLNAWFQKKNNPFIDVLLSKETRENSFLNYDFIVKTLKGYESGEANLDQKIWLLLNLELWRRIYL